MHRCCVGHSLSHGCTTIIVRMTEVSLLPKSAGLHVRGSNGPMLVYDARFSREFLHLIVSAAPMVALVGTFSYV